MRTYGILTILILAIAIFISCEKDEDKIEPTVETTVPVITGLTADKTIINVGGEDPTQITCEATGGNLEYLWEVDLGDIISMNDEASLISYTASDCCLGEKTLKCTVSNDKGSIDGTIKINIVIP